ncbi:MAG: 4Fe-4S dicluster domain-containing protein [Deltaproteobacteria bacterium]|nr:4Fe-4S dicluster domain-containing protein [Deltaproteobacteria bacterium]
MATIITSECINCGACEPECPNTAIYQGGVEYELNGVMHPPLSNDIFYIVPEKCTECVGFFDQEACAVVCPVDCCVPDPQRPESEDALIVRARELHPDKTFADGFPSRFKEGGGGAASTAGEAAPAATAKPTAAAAPAPVPAAAPAAAPAMEMSTLNIPTIEEWEVPIECHHCKGSYAVAFRHFRSGVVFYCPFCNGSTVVTSSMRNYVAQSLHTFYDQWAHDFEVFQEKRQRQLTEFEERQRERLEALNESLTQARHDYKPPGAPRKRAWIFG